jgi:hypothetical protein
MEITSYNHHLIIIAKTPFFPASLVLKSRLPGSIESSLLSNQIRREAEKFYPDLDVQGIKVRVGTFRQLGRVYLRWQYAPSPGRPQVGANHSHELRCVGRLLEKSHGTRFEATPFIAPEDVRQT